MTKDHLSISTEMTYAISAVLMFLLSLSSCSQSGVSAPTECQEEQELHPTDDKTYLRTVAEAKDCITQFLSENSTLRTSESSSQRVVKEVIDLKHQSSLRSDSDLSEFVDLFYIVTLSEDQGYAIVSKDKRCFPIFAILDNGTFRTQDLKSPHMTDQIETMVAAAKIEKDSFDKIIRSSSSYSQLRTKMDKGINTENAVKEMTQDGWRITRQSNIRTSTTWRQHIVRKNFYISKQGVLFADAYPGETQLSAPPTLRSSASDTEAFGCTPVAFGQAMYALREFPGFKTLRYTNGERILWKKMSETDSNSTEVQRFLGWITANCKPTYFNKGTMVFNTDATDFLRSKVGNYINSRYDNCVSLAGDFDGYGWSEDKRVAKDFFEHPHALVVMTAARGTINFKSYHSFVIDGMVELHKRINNKGFLGTGLFSKWRDGIRHLYHVNAGWNGDSNGYYLYVQNIGNKFKYTGSNNQMDYRSNTAYLILWPNEENK